METVNADEPKTDEQKTKDDAKFERMQRMLAQKQARRQRERTSNKNDKKEPKSDETTNNSSNTDDISTNTKENVDEKKEVTQEKEKEKEKEEEEQKEESAKPAANSTYEKMQARLAAKKKQREKEREATKETVKETSSGNTTESAKETAATTPTAESAESDTKESGKPMTQFEIMQARMAARQKGRKEGAGKAAPGPKKTAVKVQKKIDPLRNTKPLITRNARLREKRVDIVDLPASQRQSADRPFEVGNLVYFVSKDDNQYVSGNLSEFKTGGFWKIDKIVNPNNRNPALEEDEDPSRYVRTKPPTIKPEGYFKLMSPHDFETELTLEFAHMLRDYMKDILKKKEKLASYNKQKEKALARVGKSLGDDIPSAIGGTAKPETPRTKPKTPTPFQQKKLQKQNTTAITTGVSENDSPKKSKSTSATPVVTSVNMRKRKSMSNVPTESEILADKTPTSPMAQMKRRSVANLHEPEKTERHAPSKSQTVLDILDSKKKEKEKRVQPKGKLSMPTKPVGEWTVEDVQEWLMYISTRRPKSKEKKKEVPIVPFYEEYGSQFESRRIDGPKLLEQTRMTLANDLLIKNQYRPILIEFIEELKGSGSAMPRSPRASASGNAMRIPGDTTADPSPVPSRTSPAASPQSSPNFGATPAMLDETEKEWVLEKQQIAEEKQKLIEEKKKIMEVQMEQKAVDRQKVQLEEEKLQIEREKLETAKQRLEIEKEKAKLKQLQRDREELEAMRQKERETLAAERKRLTLEKENLQKISQEMNQKQMTTMAEEMKKWEEQKKKEQQEAEKELVRIAALRSQLAKEREALEREREEVQEGAEDEANTTPNANEEPDPDPSPSRLTSNTKDTKKRYGNESPENAENAENAEDEYQSQLEREKQQLKEETKQIQRLKNELEKDKARNIVYKSIPPPPPLPPPDEDTTNGNNSNTSQALDYQQMKAIEKQERLQREQEQRFSRKTPSRPLPTLTSAQPLNANVKNEASAKEASKITNYIVQFSCDVLWKGQISSSQIDDGELSGQLAQLLSGGQLKNVRSSPLKRDNGMRLNFEVHVSVDVSKGQTPRDCITEFENLLSDGTLAESLRTGVNVDDEVTIKSWDASYSKAP